MEERVGVQPGRICPGCGQENSVPFVYGMPGPEDFQQAERGVLVLGGCILPGEQAAYVCRSCDLAWGSESDLADLIGVGYADVVRALGTGWRRESAASSDDGVQWFVSGEPAQVSIGVQGPWFVLARPLTTWGEARPGPLMGDGPRLTREDLLHQPYVVAEMAETIASHRRRSFRWCRTCRRPTAPEYFTASAGACRRCVDVFAGTDE